MESGDFRAPLLLSHLSAVKPRICSQAHDVKRIIAGGTQKVVKHSLTRIARILTLCFLGFSDFNSTSDLPEIGDRKQEGKPQS
jgi:hypothetical protein